MKVDFWQLSRDPAEKVVPMIAARVLDQGERLLVVSADQSQRAAIARALWEAEKSGFPANGDAADPHAARQPILLSDRCEAVNGASHVIFADGAWHEPTGFTRAFLLFSEETLEAARGVWRALDGTEGIERSFFRQDAGKWTRIA